MKWLEKWIHGQREFMANRVAALVERKIVHTMLADLGVAELERVVAQAKENQKTGGQSDYANLAELYIKIMRERQNASSRPSVDHL